MNKRSGAVIIVCLMVLSSLFCSEKNKTFPQKDRTITVVCPQAAGGGTDAIIRALTSEIAKKQAVNIIVKNIAGNGTAAGTDYVVKQPADGYTVLVGGSYTISAAQQGLTAGYMQLETIAGLNEDPFIFGVKKGSQFNSFSQLVDYAKKHPGEIVLGSAGAGSTNHVASVGMNGALGRPFTVKPFNGGAGVLDAVRNGGCTAGLFSQSEVVSSSDIVPLVILTDGHSTLRELAAVPTLDEQGYKIEVPGFSFRAVMVKKGTPRAVKIRLVGMIKKAYYSDFFQSYQKQSGLIQVYSELDKADKFMAELFDEFQMILKEDDIR